MAHRMDFILWWRKLNAELISRGAEDARQDEARYWHNAESPPRAAATIIIESRKRYPNVEMVYRSFWEEWSDAARRLKD